MRYRVVETTNCTQPFKLQFKGLTPFVWIDSAEGPYVSAEDAIAAARVLSSTANSVAANQAKILRRVWP